MKPKTKKTLIIAAAIVAIVAIVWYTFVWRKSVNGIISRLDVDKQTKRILRDYSKNLLTVQTSQSIQTQATADGLTFNLEVVDWARYNAVRDGKITETVSDSIYSQLYSMKP